LETNGDQIRNIVDYPSDGWERKFLRK
jgi:hypothetical protein